MTSDGHDPANAAEWDERYATERRGTAMWSGAPNGALVAEVAGMSPGTALDVACGEGADAVWLARAGWAVTAVEPSGVALGRARAAGAAAGVEVAWLHAGLLDVADRLGTHDLVTTLYPALRRTDGGAPVAALLDAVAPGGTLLFVHHDMAAAHTHDHAEEAGFAPDAYVMPADVAAALGAGWTIEVHERRPRPDPPEDTPHVDDVVLRARRTAR